MQNFNRLTRSPVFREYCRFVIRESTKITSIICLTSAIVDSRCTVISNVFQSAYRNANKFSKAQAAVIGFFFFLVNRLACNPLLSQNQWSRMCVALAIRWRLYVQHNHNFRLPCCMYIHAKIKIDFTRRSACGGLHFRARNHYKIGVARVQVGIVICRSIAEWSLDQAFDPIPGGRYRFRIIRRIESLVNSGPSNPALFGLRNKKRYHAKCFKQFW